MGNAGSVSSDPYPVEAMPFPRFFACKTHDRRKPSMRTDLYREQVAVRALANTGTIPSPFANLSVTDNVSE